MVGARLRRVVRRAGSVRRFLGEHLVRVEREIAVDLAGGNVVKPLHPDRPRRLEQRLGAEHVRAKEAPGIDDRQAVVRLGREVHDRVELLVAQQSLGQLAVADVSFDEDDPVFNVLEARSTAGVGEQVEDDEVIVRMPLEPEADEIRADEPGAAGNEHSHRRKPSGRVFDPCTDGKRPVLGTKSHAFVGVAMSPRGSSWGQSSVLGPGHPSASLARHSRRPSRQ